MGSVAGSAVTRAGRSALRGGRRVDAKASA